MYAQYKKQIDHLSLLQRRYMKYRDMGVFTTTERAGF